MRWVVVGLLFLTLEGCQPDDLSQEPGLRGKTQVGAQAPGETAPQDKAAQAANPDRIYQLSDLKTTKVSIGKNKFTLWVMDTNSKRQEGMMFLTDPEVKMDQGMLFVFPEAEDQSFWMKNTLIPLDIAFISKDKKILNTAQMKPHDETGTPSKGKAQYVLEMKKGAFQHFGIKAGQQVVIQADVKAEE